ncbi:MAG: alpha-glucan family phosphorylase [Planctomycetes bacterium]|nr:alpha-glucan family phosphorylase [Planctomycetota bacterium]
MQFSLKDPVCGMSVRDDAAFTVSFHGQRFCFCSEFCKKAFVQDPEKYAAPNIPLGATDNDMARRIAYFSMEVAVEPDMPTYSGGLGVLAGDTLRSAADLRIPVVAVTLLSAKGYFDQQLDEWGNQREAPVAWNPASNARKLPERVEVTIEGRSVHVGAWQHDIIGNTGYRVPLLLLDTNDEGNSPADRELTAYLYGGDQRYRLAQEVILGIGGVRMLRALGYRQVERFHMNEGHAALLVLELLGEGQPSAKPGWDFNGIRESCVFTTHTPVPAGHDQFGYDLVSQILGEQWPLDVLRMLGGADRLNMTCLALNLSHRINGVAKKHGEVSQAMFPGYAIDSITNGVHSVTWTSDSFRSLYDRHIPGWRNDPASLRHAMSISVNEIWQAHVAAKEKLIEAVARQSQVTLDRDVLTIGFARRATAYKRADLIFANLERLREISRTAGPLQLVFGGKAHPHDNGGKDLIRRIFDAARQLKDCIKVVYLANYDLALAKVLTAGVDLWLNTPLRPLEASGTSGMKAAHNGVPSLSILDGWWIEGHIEGVTGWSIGNRDSASSSSEQMTAEDAADLYAKLGTVVLPTFYRNRERWIEIMRQAIAFNASFFNTHRMVQQYAANAYV